MKPVLRWLLLMFACWGMQAPATTLPSLTLSAEQLQQPRPIEHSLLLEDPSGTLTATEVLQALPARGVLHSGIPRLGYSTSAWWAAVQLQLPALQRLSLLIDHPFLDDLQVWVFDGRHLAHPLYSGDRLPFLQRGAPYPHFMLNLPPLGQGPHTLLVRVQSGSSISLPMQLVNADQAPLLSAQAWLQSGLLLGAMLSFALFYLIRFATLREPQMGYFCITVVGVAVYNATVHGLTGLLLPDWPWLPPLLANLANPVMLIFSTLFLASALKLRLGRLRWARDLLFASTLVVCSWSLVSDQAYATLNVVILITGLFQMLLVLLGLWQRRPYALGYLLCWSTALVLMLIVPLSRSGLMPLPPGFIYLHAYLPAISMLLFAALLDRQLERVRRALLVSQAQAISNLEQYRALFRSASEGIFRCTSAGILLEANPSLARFLQPDMAPDALVGTAIQRLLGASTWQQLTASLNLAQPAISQECQLHDLQGTPRWVYLSLHLRPAQDCIEGIVVDLSERRALEERLQHLAARDSLTGLLNRRELERLLQESLNGGARRFSHLLYLDLDQFKQVNDLCGHSAGDQLLRQLASRLQHQLPPSAELARVGGDEFAVLLRDTDDQAANCQAEHLRRSVEQFLFTWEGRPFRLYASIGLLALGPAVSDWQGALNWADSASQQAKHQGRNRVLVFNPADGALLEHQRQLQWITRLREGLDQGHFELFFQPVMALQHSDTRLHYEVLLRYRDPISAEWIGPAQFLGAAERYGLLGAIDRWVIQHLLQWLAANPRHLERLAQVNVNLSAASLLDSEFHQQLSTQLHEYGLPPAKLCIEVTEMVALGELGVSSRWIKQLRSQGLKVALDDFGSGFASYAYLRHLPLDILKIDGSFIRDLEADPINQAMVRSMQQIAAQLGLQTVAEFVESQATLDCLRELGIDYAQGYFIDHPRPLALLRDGLDNAAKQAIPEL
ncbi:diguanylate cyclase (GGDEF) domain-containing protein [Pseudomonas cuatrocienegasensis]|uniref:Diguanylate cyclase (GGDEF) domain-containing protein n=1 Tax=Pseudomonas cuatrocienegasensis TaxID=543360 RepID=A0ABY1BQA2_9PSED|nr:MULTISPECIES: EAL domain-containing protein [Pseudomonas]OEC33158.1 diguanylate cyclase [Pseudomonas sp. 21C1]SER36931.1 diguanylate cyclase (GGDEF) domain-containing protein [Pseudomonas cuatrocienegasensis]